MNFSQVKRGMVFSITEDIIDYITKEINFYEGTRLKVEKKDRKYKIVTFLNNDKVLNLHWRSIGKTLELVDSSKVKVIKQKPRPKSVTNVAIKDEELFFDVDGKPFKLLMEKALIQNKQKQSNCDIVGVIFEGKSLIDKEKVNSHMFNLLKKNEVFVDYAKMKFEKILNQMTLTCQKSEEVQNKENFSMTYYRKNKLFFIILVNNPFADINQQFDQLLKKFINCRFATSSRRSIGGKQ